MKHSQNTVVNLVILPSIIILLFLAQFGYADNNVEAKTIDITIKKSDIYFNNTKLSIPGSIDQLNKLLGKNTRSKSTSLAWDTVGIKVINRKKLVGELQIYLKKRSPFEKPKTNSLGRHMVDMRPIHDFSGTLTIDGIEISSDTTIPKLNKSLKGAEFSKDALYKTYRRSYVPNPKNKNVSCTIYLKLSDNNKVYQVSRECIDWRQYSTNATKKTAKETPVTDVAQKTPRTTDLNQTSALSIIDAQQKKYALSDKQLVEFKKRVTARKEAVFLEKATIIDNKIRNGDITQKQADRLVMLLLYPGLTPEKLSQQKKAQNAIENTKEKMSTKDQAALKIATGLMVLHDMLGGDSLNDKELRKIAEHVKTDIPKD